MADPRERRLAREFERMCALRSEHALIDFKCADLTTPEATEFLKVQISADVIVQAWPGFVSPDEFMQQSPGVAPEKYLITYTCKGLVRNRDNTISESTSHAMEVVFGWDYPSRPPTVVWLTPLWHPNFERPHVCTEGRPFSIGLTLDQIVLNVGEMIAYRNYNVADPLNAAAAQWARRNRHRFPVDDRDLLDERRRIGTLSGERAPGDAPLVQLEPLAELVDPTGDAGLVSLIDDGDLIELRPRTSDDPRQA